MHLSIEEILQYTHWKEELNKCFQINAMNSKIDTNWEIINEVYNRFEEI